jgi:hypothetical protein
VTAGAGAAQLEPLEPLEPAQLARALEQLEELSRTAGAALAYLYELTRWAGELTVALHDRLPRRYAVTIRPPDPAAMLEHLERQRQGG